ncbi:PAS domain S-box protein [Chlorobium sp. KB01]|uniref:hybrid sensor histidine kinase/response regulator n=1 Tax=Chlorobium sp. KB01 TaxID=1917528 RepID=UPI0009764BCF|nr:PAS domain S-box protein [Chlorobium sp. KB01]
MQNSTHKREEKERNAQQRESTLNAVFDAVAEPAFIMDREGTILDANQAFARVCHKEVQACINVNAYDFLPPELAAARRIKVDEVFRTGRRMIYEDEQEGHCYRNTLYPIAGLDGRTSQIYIVAQDITDLKRSERDAETTQTLFGALKEAVPGAFYMLDPLTGNIIDANQAAAAFYGWSIDELCRKHIREVDTLPEEELTRFMSQNRLSGKNQFAFQHRRADGSIRDVEVFSSNITIGGRELLYAIVHDVTERRAAERELQKLSVAMQQSHAIVVITDLKGDIEYVNPAFTISSGYSQEEVIGKNPRMLQSGTMPQPVYAELWQTILAGGVWKGEVYNRRKNGEFYWESAVISPVLNEEGVITNFVAIKEDITEKKKLWSELIAAKEHAEESDRLKTAFLANISHEIRTPMNGIVGLSEILKDPDLSKDEQSLYIDLIDQSCQRLLFLINDIIDISRIEAGKTNVKIGRTPVNTTLRDLHAFFKPLAEQKGLRLSCSAGLSDSESVIETDSTKLTQILTNLLQNALKFTKEGHIDFGYACKKNTLEFYVADSGIGISPDIQTKIFERFRQADNSLTRNYEGAGLGLSISQAYIEMLGGRISVKSIEGKGSEFIFTLPYNPAGFVETDVQPDAVRPNHDSLPVMTILIAEDDAVSGILLEKTLQAESITILSAGNGLDAVELVKAHPEIGLVLMDIKMPVMDGFDATRLIKQFRPGLPVIMQSAFTSESERGKAEAAGCCSFITKPVKKELLLELIHAALNRQPDKQ